MNGFFLTTAEFAEKNFAIRISKYYSASSACLSEYARSQAPPRLATQNEAESSR